MRTYSLIVGSMLAGVVWPSLARGQASDHALTSAARPIAGQPVTGARASGASLDSLIARAVATSPALRAASARVDAARARVGPASALPDPMLMLGVINQPLGRRPVAADGMPATTGPDAMTMRMVGVTQTLPFPGRRALQGRDAERGVDVARASVDIVRRQIVRDVKAAYYDIAFGDQALAIIERNRDMLAGLIRIAEVRYSVGTAGQRDVLRARVEATRLAETASGLLEQRRAAVARINALLDQSADVELPALAVPEHTTRLAVAASPDAIRASSSPSCP
jgi:outer membrane protein TolC